MTLENNTVEILQRFLANQPNSDNKNNNFTQIVNGFKINLDVVDFDKYSFILKQVRVRNTKVDNDLSLDELKARAEKLTKTVNYLLEDLRVVEIDGLNSKIQVLSDTPRPSKSGRTFYEVILEKNHTVKLYRIQFDSSTKQRQQIPFQITADVLENLVQDLILVVQN